MTGLAAKAERLLRRYPLSLACVAAVWYLSLFRPPHTRLDHVAGIDKVVHAVMYLGTCGMMWWEYLRAHGRLPRRRVAAALVVVPVAMSGAIELLQEYATTFRSGEWADLAANSTGVALAALLGTTLMPRLAARRRRDGKPRKPRP